MTKNQANTAKRAENGLPIAPSGKAEPSSRKTSTPRQTAKKSLSGDSAIYYMYLQRLIFFAGETMDVNELSQEEMTDLISKRDIFRFLQKHLDISPLEITNMIWGHVKPELMTELQNISFLWETCFPQKAAQRE